MCSHAGIALPSIAPLGPRRDRATQVPVVHSVSFGYDDLDTWRAVALGEAEGHV